MQDTITTETTPPIKQGHSALSVLAATLITMCVLWFISNLSFLTAVTIGSFAGFCIAAWNWFRMGRRRMALIYVLLGIAVYLSISIGYALLAVVLNQILLPLPPPELSIDIPGIVSSGERIISAVQLNPLISILLVMYCVGAGALVLFYLYRVTARAIPPTAPLEDGDELKRFLPLLAVAAISTTAVIVFNIVAMQVRTAQLQNHIYCEVLQLGMTHKEVSIALNEVSPQTHVWFEDTPYPALSEKATYYRVIYWDNYYLDRNYDLSLWLGYDASDRLVWRGRFWSAKNLPEEGVDTIECPWTFYQSVTAR